MDLDDKQKPLTNIWYVLHQKSGLGDLFLSPEYRKTSLEKSAFQGTLFAYFFKVHLLIMCFHGLHWARLW